MNVHHWNHIQTQTLYRHKQAHWDQRMQDCLQADPSRSDHTGLYAEQEINMLIIYETGFKSYCICSHTYILTQTQKVRYLLIIPFCPGASWFLWSAQNDQLLHCPAAAAGFRSFLIFLGYQMCVLTGLLVFPMLRIPHGHRCTAKTLTDIADCACGVTWSESFS